MPRGGGWPRERARFKMGIRNVERLPGGRGPHDGARRGWFTELVCEPEPEALWAGVAGRAECQGVPAPQPHTVPRQGALSGHCEQFLLAVWL